MRMEKSLRDAGFRSEGVEIFASPVFGNARDRKGAWIGQRLGGVS